MVIHTILILFTGITGIAGIIPEAGAACLFIITTRHTGTMDVIITVAGDIPTTHIIITHTENEPGI